MTTQRTFCRICQAYCGLLADVEDGRVVSIRADRDHPVSRGYTCTKGRAIGEILTAPDRLLAPRLRGRDATWAETLDDLAAVPWADRVTLHVSDEGTRADFDAVLGGWREGWHVYTCGPDRYMSAVMAAAERTGFPEEARHLEYFSVPELPEYENHDFTLRLARSGREFLIPADQTATDVLAENGVHVDVKCSDGICGVCKCRLISGEVEHRDFVLSKAQRADSIILCQSRAAGPGGVVEVDL